MGGLLAATLVACDASESPQPEARDRRAPDVCLDPLPPPAFVVRQGSDPSACLPEGARGVLVSIAVSADGRAQSVDQGIDLCLTETADGRIESAHKLVEGERQCILHALRDWRFLRVETCHPVTTSLSLGRSERAFDAGACRG